MALCQREGAAGQKRERAPQVQRIPWPNTSEWHGALSDLPLATQIEGFFAHANLPTLIKCIEASGNECIFRTALRPLIQLIEKKGEETIDKISESCLATDLYSNILNEQGIEG